MKVDLKQSHLHIIDDFEDADLSNWYFDVIYDYRAEGPIAKDIKVVYDSSLNSQVLRVDIDFPRYSGGKLLICRRLRGALPPYRYRSISFWYKIDAQPLNREPLLICRLRRGNTSNLDYLVAKGKELSFGTWNYVSLCIDKPTFDELVRGMRKGRPRTSQNIWGTYPHPLEEFCLIIEAAGEERQEFRIFIDDIRLEVKEEPPHYQPKVIERRVDEVLKCLLIKQSAAGFYGFEEAFESLPGNKEIRKSLFRGLHLPLSYFPESLEELMSFDIVVLVDTDPYVLTMDQLKMLCDFVASGGALIVAGGPQTFGCSLDFKEILKEILPVKFESRRDLVEGIKPVIITGKHIITEGIPANKLGVVGEVHRLEIKEKAQVLLKAGDYPLIVVWEYQRGRVLVLNACPRPDPLKEGSLFLSDQYDDLMRRAFQWLTNQEPLSFITEFSLSKDVLLIGDSTDLKVKVRSQGNIQVKYSVLRGATVIQEERRNLMLKGEVELKFEFKTKGSYSEKENYLLRLEVLDEFGKVQDLRDCRVKVVPPVELRIDMPFEKDVTAPGRLFEFTVDSLLNSYVASVELDKMRLRTRIFDFKGSLIKDFGERRCRKADYRFLVPPLLKGEYSIVSTLIDEKGDVVDEVERKFYVVNKMSFESLFPLISIIHPDGGGLFLDEEGLRERIEDHIAHGFNTVSINGLRNFNIHNLPTRARLLNFIERYAQMRDQLIMYDYEHFTTTPWRNEPTYPCVFSEAYRRSLENYLKPQIDAAKKVPRLLCVKIIDEPTANERSIDYCNKCRRVFREKYGEDLPSQDEDLSTKPRRKLHFRKFISDYISEAYKQASKVKEESEADFRLLLTFMRTGFGYAWRRKWEYIEDVLAWGRHADMIDFDIYPYFYPGSNKLGFRFLDIHYCFALLRNIAEFLGKPMGFYIELDDRNYPFQINPYNASSECLYTALGAGANYINSFINVSYGTGSGARAERWEDLGKELKKVSTIAPILNKVRKAKAKVALIFPYTHWIIAEDGFAPGYAFELFLRAFGEVDVIHEDIVRAKGFEGYKVLLLLETEYLPDDIATKIETFVEEGGILICDHLPTFNEDGGPCKLRPDLFSGAEEEIVRGLMIRKGTFGRGKTLLLSFNLDKTYAEAVERLDADIVTALEGMVRDYLFDLGMKPRVSTSNPEIEVNLLEGTNFACLVLVNHNTAEDSSTITVHDLGFKPSYVCDLTTMEKLAYTLTEDALSIKTTLNGHCGTILGIYPKKPVTSQIKIDKAEIVAGQEFSYSVILSDENGKPAKGSHVLEVRVIDPDGRIQSAFGGLCATIDGIYSRSVVMAINAARGKWIIEARDGYTKQICRASFLVK